MNPTTTEVATPTSEFIEAEVEALEREACKLEAEADALEAGAAAAGAKCMFLGQWKAYFNGSFWHNVSVTCHGDISQGSLKAIIAKPDCEPKELPIEFLKAWGVWRCGNGWLTNNIEYDNDQAVVLEWKTYDGRVSTWQRVSEVRAVSSFGLHGDGAMAATGLNQSHFPLLGQIRAVRLAEADYDSDSSTEEGTDDNLKENWWNVTEEWEAEKGSTKAKIKQVNEEAYTYTARIPANYAEVDAKRNKQRDATTMARKNDSRRVGDRVQNAKWVEVTAKTQKASKESSKKVPQWREVGARKNDSEQSGWGSHRQHKATSQ